MISEQAISVVEEYEKNQGENSIKYGAKLGLHAANFSVQSTERASRVSKGDRAEDSIEADKGKLHQVKNYRVP